MESKFRKQTSETTKLNASVYVCACIYIHMSMHVCMNLYMFVYTYGQTSVNIQTHFTRICTYAHTGIHLSVTCTHDKSKMVARNYFLSDLTSAGRFST